jgi:DNA-directed RNA polymerase specialized sigma24 family protein
VSVHPLTLKRFGRQPSADIAQSKYDELEAEVTATVRGKLSARKMHVVEDDLEEAYNQAWHGVCEKIKAGEKIDNLTGMLVLVTWRRAVDIYRANHPSEHEDVDVSERGVEPDLAAEVDDREKLKRLFDRLKGRLNKREREAVSLCILHGYSRPEAAKLLNVPEPALQKVMDGAMKKIGGIVASLSARGCGDEDAELIRAYAFSAIDDDREYKRAAAHVEQCASCRRYVRGLQGLAAILPPVVPLVPLAHSTSILGYLEQLFGGSHSGASALQGAAGATGAAAGGGGISIGAIGGSVAVKGFAVVVVAGALTAAAVHVSTNGGHHHPAPAQARRAPSFVVPPSPIAAASVREINRRVSRRGTATHLAATRRAAQARRARLAASREFRWESAKPADSTATRLPPTAAPKPARQESRSAVEKEFSLEH